MSPAGSGAHGEFASERLLLRSICDSDQQLYCDLFTSAATMRYIGRPLTAAKAVRVFRKALDAAQCSPPRGVFLTLTPKETLRPIGVCSLQNFDRARRTAELGMMIVPSGRAQGLATEALIAVLAHVFATLPFDEVWVRFANDHAVATSTALSGGLVRHAAAQPQDLAANLWRWSAYRGSWRPPGRTADQT